jgi:hypothetical protein
MENQWGLALNCHHSRDGTGGNDDNGGGADQRKTYSLFLPFAHVQIILVPSSIRRSRYHDSWHRRVIPFSYLHFPTNVM